jgi:hypothetical protein
VVAASLLAVAVGEPVVPPPPGGEVEVDGVVAGFEVEGVVVGVLSGGFGLVVGLGMVVCGGGLWPVSLRGGVDARVTTVVVVLPSGLIETTVLGAVGDGVSDGVGVPPTVIGPPAVGVPGTVWTPAGDEPVPPGPPVPPAVVAGAGPASSATAANAVAKTSPATPSTTYPARFGLLLLGGAVSILVMRELESDPSGRGIQAPWRSGKRGSRSSIDRSLLARAGEPGRATSAGRLSPPVPHSPS